MSVRRVETVGPATAEAYRGTFAPDDVPLTQGSPLHPGWEGVYFPFTMTLADLRPDGTPARDGVLPEFDLPRRMYAGEDTEFLHPVSIGDVVEQVTTLGEVVEKTGASGRLVFVDIVREYLVQGQVAVRTVWHDVFLPAADPQTPARAPRQDPDVARAADWVEDLVLDERQLFRFSALTFNTHLVHYDRRWAQEVEGLPDLLVHGPLTRILLMDAARSKVPRVPRALSVRAVAPIYVAQRVRLAGTSTQDGTRVVALDQADGVLASAEVRWG